MQFHFPRPTHGWQEFAGEVAIIVLGVLIALGLGEIVGSVHDRASEAETRASIRDEVRINLQVMILRNGSEECLQNRLREIDAYLDASERGQRPARLTWIGAPYAPLLSHANFQSAQNTGKFMLLPPAEQRQLASFYVPFDDFNEANTREWYDWAQLRILAKISGPLRPETIDRLREAAQDARAADALIRIDLTQALDRGGTFGKLANLHGDRYQTASVCLPSNMPYEQAAKLAGSSRLPFPG